MLNSTGDADYVVEPAITHENSDIEGRIKSVQKWLTKKERQKAKLAKQLTKKKIKKTKRN